MSTHRFRSTAVPWLARRGATKAIGSGPQQGHGGLLGRMLRPESRASGTSAAGARKSFVSATVHEERKERRRRHKVSGNWWRPVSCALAAVVSGGVLGESDSGRTGEQASATPLPSSGVARRTKRVAVVGAGASGLICAKCLLDEGLEVVVFEQEANIGGLWRYKESPDGYGGCYRSLRTLSTQRMTSFKIYPIEEWMQIKEKKTLLQRLQASMSPWAHHSQILAYLEDFAVTNSLHSKIRFRTQVLKVSPYRTGANAGIRGWKILSIDHATGERRTEDFDAVAVCNGHHWNPIFPSLAGRDDFEGAQLHSREYRYPEPFKGQRVVIVGMGDSGTAIADEISSVASITYLSTSRDIELRPWKKYIQRQTLMPRITRLKKHSVVFSDGTEAEADVIIYCTGYQMSFPFLEDELIPIRSQSDAGAAPTDQHPLKIGWLPCGDKTALFHRVIHPDYPSLAFIGLVDVHLFSVFPVSEAQSKWFACVLSERCRLPPRERMMSEIRGWAESVRDVCYQPLLIDGVSYIKQIKKEAKQEVGQA